MSSPRSRDKGGIFGFGLFNRNKTMQEGKHVSFHEPSHEVHESDVLHEEDDLKKALELDEPVFNRNKTEANHEIASEMVDEHVFPGCHIMLSQHDGAQFKWVDTQQVGWLKIVQILYPSLKDKLVTIPPIVHIRLQNVIGEYMFEFELPINFQYQPSLNAHFTAVGTIEGEWIGFWFEKEMHRAEFAQMLKKFHKALELNEKQMERIHQAAERIHHEEHMKDLENTISPEDLLGMDPAKQAEALHKLLLIAGIDEENDFHDDELMSILSEIVANFDVHEPIDEEAAIFNLRLLADHGKFMKKQADQIHRKAINSKKSRKSQYEKKEREYIQKEQERQKRIQATEEMKRQMEAIQLEKHNELKRLSAVHEDGEAHHSKYYCDMCKIFKEKLQRQCPQCSKTAGIGHFCQWCAFKLETIENVNQDKHTEDIQIVKSEENGQQNLLVNDQRGLVNVQPTPTLGQRGPPNAPPAPNSSQRGPPNPPSAKNSSQRGPPNPPSAPTLGSRGLPKAPPAPTSGQRGPPNAPPTPASGQRGVPRAPQGQRGPPVASVQSGPTPRASTGPLISKSDVKTSQSELSLAEQLQQQSLKLKSVPKKETTSELYRRTDSIIGKMSEQLKRQETSIHEQMATTLVSSQSVEVASDKGNFQFFLSVKEAQIAKAQGCGLSFEQQIAMTSKLLKPVDKGPMKVSQKVLDEQERQRKLQEMSKESRNQKMAQLTAQLHTAINKNKEKRIQRRRNSSTSEDSDDEDEDDDDSDVE